MLYKISQQTLEASRYSLKKFREVKSEIWKSHWKKFCEEITDKNTILGELKKNATPRSRYNVDCKEKWVRLYGKPY